VKVKRNNKMECLLIHDDLCFKRDTNRAGGVKEIFESCSSRLLAVQVSCLCKSLSELSLCSEFCLLA
jgi:hypothetical protein